MRTVGFAAASLGLLAVLMYWALGEMVILRTVDEDGSPRETRLWVVDYAGAAWLRSAQDHAWFQRLESNPDVELRRAGCWDPFRAVPSDSEKDRQVVNELMAEKYGIVDAIIGGVFDHSTPVVVRLEPR